MLVEQHLQSTDSLGHHAGAVQYQAVNLLGLTVVQAPTHFIQRDDAEADDLCQFPKGLLQFTHLADVVAGNLQEDPELDERFAHRQIASVEPAPDS